MARPVVLGTYELIDRIGEGGMAEVWRARARGAAGFEKIVVIKRVLPALMEKPGFGELLVREAKISSRLSHPNIAQVFGFGDDGGGYYIAMEYVDGRDLGQAMAFRGGKVEGLSLPLRIWIMSEVAKALEHAHTRKGDDQRPLSIVHRDVSPQNVLLGYEGEVKVADFGIARADEAGLGRGEDPSILRGKYAYMSPEQARGEPLDRRSDVFATGVVLFELLAGQRLFRGKTSQETLNLVRSGTMPLLDEAKLEPGLEPIVRRCLAVDRDARYPSAGELYRDLAAWLFRRGEPVGEPQLAAAMTRMFPPEQVGLENKLRVDLMMRAYEDATAISAAGAMLAPEPSSPDDRTAALPVSRKGRIEERRLGYLVLPYRDEDEHAFVAACDAAGAQIFRPLDGYRVAAFGYGTGLEEPAAHAARAALELRRIARIEAAPGAVPVPPMVVLDGPGRVLEGVVLEPDEALVAMARDALALTPPGDIGLSGTVAEELASSFRVVTDQSGRAELEGFRARHEREAAAMRKLPLVGRTPELRKLSECLGRALAGQSEVVHLIGEAGVGKSRLVAELRALAAPREVAFLVASASEPERESRHAILADLVRDLCGIEPEDVPQERFAKIERLRVLGLTPREVRILGELSGLMYPTALAERSGRPRGIEVIVAIRRALVALAHDRAVVVVLENAHWADDASRQLVPLLVRGLRRSRVLVLVTSRPGLGMPAIDATPMRVLPLGQDATARLCATLLGAREAPAELARRVLTETAGNPQWIPLVVPEVVRALGEGAEVVVPAALARAIEGRVESLDPAERALLQTASAYDAPLSVELLLAIDGLVGEPGLRALERLLARCLVAPAPGVPVPVDFTLVYPVGRWGGHDAADLPTSIVVPAGVVRRAALAELSAEQRARLHERIVLAVERSTVPVEGRVERLAYHAQRTSDRRRAPDYLVASAEQAERSGAPARAAEDLACAARVLREDGDSSDAPRAQALALRGIDLALAANDGALAARVLAELRANIATAGVPDGRARLGEAEARVALGRDDPAAALAAIEAVADTTGVAPAALGRLRLVEGRALVVAGRLAPAARALEQAVASLASAGDTLLEGRALALLSDVQARGGAGAAARATVARVMALAARHADPFVRFESLAALGAALEAEGDALGAMERFREALEVATGVGLHAETTTIGLRAAVAALRARREAEAGARAGAVLDIARRRRFEVAGILASAVQAAVAASSFPDGAYAASITRSADKLEALGRPLELAVCLEMLGRSEAASGNQEAARSAFARGAEVAAGAGWTVLGDTLARQAAAAAGPGSRGPS